MYNFRNFLPGRGPYPFLIAFCATRDHLAGQVCVPPALRDSSCFREISFVSPLPHLRSVTVEKSPTWNVRIHFAPYGRNGEADFFLLTGLLLRTVHIKHYYGFIWNLPCPAATPTFFTSLVFQQQDHMRFPFRYCLNFENIDLIFLPFFAKYTNYFIRI